jgi:hypothetical protein
MASTLLCGRHVAMMVEQIAGTPQIRRAPGAAFRIGFPLDAGGAA